MSTFGNRTTARTRIGTTVVTGTANEKAARRASPAARTIRSTPCSRTIRAARIALTSPTTSRSIARSTMELDAPPGDPNADGTSAMSGAVIAASMRASGECRPEKPAMAIPTRTAISSARVNRPRTAMGRQQSPFPAGVARRTIVASPRRATSARWTGRTRSRRGRSPVTRSPAHRSGRFASLREPRRVVRLVDALVDLGLGQQEREATVPDRLLGDDAFADVGPLRDVVHHLEQRFLDDRAQGTGPGLALEGDLR